ncbi:MULTISPECIES: S8 family serine peptidase [unclassified Lysobacter]|uniref:S8 family serine peptidase n=1 Tax=unclassified Lysobacter TaxID=2635362 RepID=UPI001BE8A6BE|nr:MULTISPECIES: S8 family serine peptidase [unclassified Lysobacter]MBT2747726.1 S8 family serine peptidase [Lysobacter sp. ISL-42]MBT2754044.1 S8 family serine peptidase [Lysobacter sp. ISL-50]MBT2779677.1 S8 family serine peptidase [Lysobacter sp. ISL-54]MBT2780144.1 S8 family serine peptidase [Lysobacter sp. ISL-52]
MNQPTARQWAAFGLAGACAVASLVAFLPQATRIKTQVAADAPKADHGRIRAHGGHSNNTVELTPRTAAQAKLGRGQLLQALQQYRRSYPGDVSTGGTAGAGRGGPVASARAAVAARTPAAVAAQIAALDRAGLPAPYRDGEKVKVSLRLSLTVEQIEDSRELARAAALARESLRAQGVEAHPIPGSPMLEAAIALARLEAVASLKEIGSIQMATLPRTTAVVSEGLALSGIDALRRLGLSATEIPVDLRRELDGQGVTIAVVDQFSSDNIADLQDSGEWPKNSETEPNKLTTIGLIPDEPFGVGDPGESGRHGNSVTEIIYDFAPRASYRLYDTGSLSSHIKAIQDAAGLDEFNVIQGAPRAQVINLSIGYAGGVSPGDGTAGNGELTGLYAAFAAARKNGVLITQAAGNQGSANYWDGEATAGPGTVVHQDFVPDNRDANGADILDDVNLLGNPRRDYCFPVGAKDPLWALLGRTEVRLTWSDWRTADHNTSADYRLELVRWADEVTVMENGKEVVKQPAGWVVAAQSDEAQDGGNAAAPTEVIDYAPQAMDRTARCDAWDPPNDEHAAGGGIFGVRIVRKTHQAGHFLRLFTSETRPMAYSHRARTLVAPADSADVVTVAALDVSAPSVLRPTSSRGPVLGPGGTRPSSPEKDTNPKPNLASFTGGATKSSKWGFFGTSAATPHVAGLAALSLQYQRMLAMNNARWASTPPHTGKSIHAILAESSLSGALQPGASGYEDWLPPILAQRREDMASATLKSMYAVAGSAGGMWRNRLSANVPDYGHGLGVMRYAPQAEGCFLASLYDYEERHRRWLAPTALTTHGVPFYLQRHGDASQWCGR